ncbi:MAG TPA: hypothetical protein H9862_07900, partial [Candidatus Akkermansia intestinigallinarum]|nr:hypothetical protein [Candidatus Akkermansia intestinigallinarum]
MIRRLFLTASLLLGSAACLAQAAPQSGTEHLYDRHGNYQGRVVTDASGNKRYYDRHGNYQGRSQSNGNGG